MNNYYIKDNYKINEMNVTNDNVSDSLYWNKARNLAAEVYQFPVYEFVSKYIKDNTIDSLIDIGCGVGRKLVHINKENPSVNIVGIDQDDPIKYCNTNYNFGKSYADDFENSKLDESIKSDLILSSDVIEHLINPDLLLDYIKTKLNKNGAIILSTPERDLYRGVECNYSPNKHHIREWNFKEFEQYLENRGFEIIDHFVQHPIKMSLNRIYYNQIIKRFLTFKPLKYNQVIILKVK